MQIERAQQPIAAAAVTLVLWILGVASFLPPLFQQYTSQSVLLMIGAGIGIFVCMVLHLIFIGIAAKRLGRSPLLWVILTLCTAARLHHRPDPVRVVHRRAKTGRRLNACQT
jgi:protein-S-isoprenylcysteine O-methyltransferase Ste14